MPNHADAAMRPSRRDGDAAPAARGRASRDIAEEVPPVFALAMREVERTVYDRG